MLSNKRAVITGGSDGIGLGIAEAYARNGADLLIVSRNKIKLKQAAKIISSHNTEVITLPADLANTEEVRKTANKILTIWPEIDILVNNAGTGDFIPFAETTEAELDLHLNINVPPLFSNTRLA